MNLPKLNRLFHRWASILIAGPVLLVILTGILLLLKKDVAWIQPPTMSGSSAELKISFDEILDIARSVPEAAIKDWDDIDRLDVRPGEGMLKVRGFNQWEIQSEEPVVVSEDSQDAQEPEKLSKGGTGTLAWLWGFVRAYGGARDENVTAQSASRNSRN